MDWLALGCRRRVEAQRIFRVDEQVKEDWINELFSNLKTTTGTKLLTAEDFFSKTKKKHLEKQDFILQMNELQRRLSFVTLKRFMLMEEFCRFDILSYCHTELFYSVQTKNAIRRRL